MQGFILFLPTIMLYLNLQLKVDKKQPKLGSMQPVELI